MVDTQAALPSMEKLQISERSIQLESSPKLLEVTRQLGDGAQAKVYEAHFENESIENSVAVKVFNNLTLGSTELAAEREFQILKALEGHENVLKASQFVRGNG